MQSRKHFFKFVVVVTGSATPWSKQPVGLCVGPQGFPLPPSAITIDSRITVRRVGNSSTCNGNICTAAEFRCNLAVHHICYIYANRHRTLIQSIEHSVTEKTLPLWKPPFFVYPVASHISLLIQYMFIILSKLMDIIKSWWPLLCPRLTRFKVGFTPVWGLDRIYIWLPRGEVHYKKPIPSRTCINNPRIPASPAPLLGSKTL